MTVHQFPPHRIVRTANQCTVGLSPLAFMFLPLRLWVQCVTQWMDIMTDAEPPSSITFHFGRLDRD
jgi:hypothetical protein